MNRINIKNRSHLLLIAVSTLLTISTLTAAPFKALVNIPPQGFKNVDITTDTTIKQLKDVIAKTYNLDASKLILKRMGKVLEDITTLPQNGIRPEDDHIDCEIDATKHKTKPKQSRTFCIEDALA